uniref:HORMA domain-containing protein n=1 Tax=Felis catus TaxID=9685 RepID=A0ABI7Y6D8_FELCA
MATAQLSRSIKIHKASKETVFPSQITNEHASLIMVKKLFATSISCITYLRGLFPESSYGERHLDDSKNEFCVQSAKFSELQEEEEGQRTSESLHP